MWKRLEGLNCSRCQMHGQYWLLCLVGQPWPVYLLREMLSNSRDHIFLGSARRQVLHVMELPVLLETCSLQFSKLTSSRKHSNVHHVKQQP